MSLILYNTEHSHKFKIFSSPQRYFEYCVYFYSRLVGIFTMISPAERSGFPHRPNFFGALAGFTRVNYCKEMIIY